VVVIDVARDGRRFAGRRAGAVVRAVADRLTDRLPRGARLRLGESDALSITLPEWDQAAATEWMHRTLPGLLAGFDTGEDLPAAQLRAAVHDAEGPVGAQILQSLERPTGRRHGAGADRGSAHQGSGERWADLDDRRQDTGRSGRRHSGEREARPWEPTPDPGPQDSRWEGSAGSGRAGESGYRHEAGAASASGSSADGGGRRHRHGTDAEPTERGETRHAEADRATGRGTDRGTASTGAGGGGTAAASDAGAGSGNAAPESTEGLGIADLLAGALAAYRAI
jgi:hypothetical protein